MIVYVNSKQVQASDHISLKDLLISLGYQEDGSACAVDECIVSKKNWSEFIVKENMHIDVFSIVAGG